MKPIEPRYTPLKPIETTLNLLLILITAINLDVVHLPIRQGLSVFFEVTMEARQALAGLVANISVGAKLQATLMDVLTSKAAKNGEKGKSTINRPFSIANF